MPKTNLIKNGKLKGKETDKLASIERLSPPIPAKTLSRSMRSPNFSKQKHQFTPPIDKVCHTHRSLKTKAILKVFSKLKKSFPLSRLTTLIASSK